jgi:NADH dehydrogenase
VVGLPACGVRALERKLPPHSARITIVSESSFLLYSPLLPAVAGGALNPRHVTIPIRQQLQHAQLLIGRVTRCDPARRELEFVSVEGETTQLPYDQLVVALGSVSRNLPLAEHAIGFESIIEALVRLSRAARRPGPWSPFRVCDCRTAPNEEAEGPSVEGPWPRAGSC